MRRGKIQGQALLTALQIVSFSLMLSLLSGCDSGSSQPAASAEGEDPGGLIADLMRRRPQWICEPNYVYHSLLFPDDPMFSQTWGMNQIGAPGAWEWSTGSAAVKVAIIDTGIAYRHPDLSANIAINTAEIANGADDDGNGYPDDVLGWDFVDVDNDPDDLNGHGTHLAGTVGAVSNNTAGVAGLNWQAAILPIRVLDEFGTGSLDVISSGINYAVARGAQIINLSLGGPYPSEILRQSLQNAAAADVVVVVAAGNGDFKGIAVNTDYFPIYPAGFNLNNMIVVTASDQHDQLPAFANYGPKSVHLAAPGLHILSTAPALFGADFSYGYRSGTSMAVPHVAGTAALIKSLNPSLPALEVKSIILNTADHTPLLQALIASGGRLNTMQAVAAAVGGLIPAPVPGTKGSPVVVDPSQGAVVPAVAIDIVKDTNRKASFYGYLYDFNSLLGISGVKSDLICDREVVASTISVDGSLYFRSVRKGPTKKICYSSVPAFNITSNKVRLRSRTK